MCTISEVTQHTTYRGIYFKRVSVFSSIFTFFFLSLPPSRTSLPSIPPVPSISQFLTPSTPPLTHSCISPRTHSSVHSAIHPSIPPSLRSFPSPLLPPFPSTLTVDQTASFSAQTFPSRPTNPRGRLTRWEHREHCDKKGGEDPFLPLTAPPPCKA